MLMSKKLIKKIDFHVTSNRVYLDSFCSNIINIHIYRLTDAGSFGFKCVNLTFFIFYTQTDMSVLGYKF